MGISDHITRLLRNLCAGQEATVRTGHVTTDWLQLGKWVHQGCILSPCLFNLYAEFSSVTQSCLTLCNSMDWSIPGLPVHHQLPEFTQNHVHWVSDAIQPPHPLSSPSPSAFNLSQHQGLFKWVSSSHQVAKVLEFQLKHQSLQWTPRTDLLQDGLVGSPWSPRDSQASSPTSQFKSINSSVLSFLYSPTRIHIWLLEKP